MAIEAITLNVNPLATTGESYSRTLTRGQFESYRHKKRAMGGYYRASWEMGGSIDELYEFMVRNLTRDVKVFNHRGTGVWEGLIFEMQLTVGGFLLRTSVQNMANRMWARYYNGSSTVTSSVYNNTASQARYGIRENVLSAGEATSGIANQLVQTQLERMPDPSVPTVKYRGGGKVGRPTLRVVCRGYWDTLWWKVYNQTSVSGAKDASAVVADVISAVGDFALSTAIENNPTQIEQKIDADRWAGDFIRSIANYGNSQFERFVAGFGWDREFYYRAAAPSKLPWV